MTEKPASIERYGRLLTAAAEGGIPSSRLAGLEQDIMRDPGICVDALAQFARLADGMAHPFADGYLILIEVWLTNLRLMAEAGHEQAEKAIAEFQRHLAAIAGDGDIDADMFLALTLALGHAGIEVTEKVEAMMGRYAAEFADDDGVDGEHAIADALSDLAALAGNDPFAIIAMMTEAGHAMPAAAKAAMAAELAAQDMAAAGVLFLLDPAQEVRAASASALKEIAARLDGVSLRRLIALRNWVPEGERAGIDAIIRTARAPGVACAPWPDSSLEEIHASSLDGAGAQGLMLVTRAERKRRLSSILTKNGVRDAWTAPQTKAEITAVFAMARRESGLDTVSRRYLDIAVCHHLHVGLAAGAPPPAGLLEIAEEIGAADWTPQAFEWRAELERLEKALPAAARADKRRRDILEHSEFWSLNDAAHESWFEDGPHVMEALKGVKRHDRARATERVLEQVLAPASNKWAGHFTWTAMRLHECEKPPAMWENFTILASALATGMALAGIPVMRAIAERTAEAAWTR